MYDHLVPNLAVDLRVAGESAQADGLLASDDALLAEKLRQSPDASRPARFLAQLRAAQGRDDEAAKALAAAVNGGWLPDRMFYATDIAEEPCFARLVKRPDFQAIRARILARIEEERRKVPLALLHPDLSGPIKGCRVARRSTQRRSGPCPWAMRRRRPP